MNCRHCGSAVTLPFLDLGSSPPSNAYLHAGSLQEAEPWFPLRVLVCEECWLVQTQDFADAGQLFDDDYAYFSGFSSTWVDHCRHYVADMVDYLALDDSSHVIEVASNDGTLLHLFDERGIRCTGVEPTAGTAAVARELGLTVVEEFLTVEVATGVREERGVADLLVANNVLAHVPDVNDFAAACCLLLGKDGVATLEFPHLVELIENVQFDTVYHEHFSYLSLVAVESIFSKVGLQVFDVKKLPTHGGSLRIFAQRAESGKRLLGQGLDEVRSREAELGVMTQACYTGFQAQTNQVKNAFLRFLLKAQEEASLVAAYGAAAKGNTLLNYAGVRPDLLSFVADLNPAKQGLFLPGSRIPILGESEIAAKRPDYVVILPWNLKEEVSSQLQYVKEWEGLFVTAVPELSIW